MGANDASSPDGRFQIGISAWEARMSHWIETPTLTDARTREDLVTFQDGNWSLDVATWLDDHTVQFVMRKYPGNHKPVDVTATIDCTARTATVDGKPVKSLHELERAMNAAIEFY